MKIKLLGGFADKQKYDHLVSIFDPPPYKIWDKFQKLYIKSVNLIMFIRKLTYKYLELYK